MLRLITIRNTERAVLYRRGDPVRLLLPGRHIVPAWPLRATIKRFDANAPRLPERGLRELVQAGVLGSAATVVDLADGERALLWIDGRYAGALGPGLSAYWNGPRDVRVEAVEVSEGRIEHSMLGTILELESGATGTELIEVVEVPADHEVLIYRTGQLLETLGPGRYGFWKGVGRLVVRLIDRREQVLDVGGQDLMTADRVTLRINATLNYRVVDSRLAHESSPDPEQTLYRDVQLALRSVVGTRTLEALLAEREAVADELESDLRSRAEAMGLRVDKLGIRDVVLPGEMKSILNRVMEAKQTAEANLITRREETAAMRSQANTAKMLEANPTLMRLRELEVLEKVADRANLQVVLTEGGLTDRVVKLV